MTAAKVPDITAQIRASIPQLAKAGQPPEWPSIAGPTPQPATAPATSTPATTTAGTATTTTTTP